MATISALAVRLTLNAAGFSPAAVAVAGNITNIGNTAVIAREKIRGLNQEAERSEGIFSKAAGAIKSNLSALLGLAGAGSIAAGIKAAADAEDALYKGAKTNIGATQTLSALLKVLKQSVEGMYAAFGKAFIESSALKDGIIVLTGIFDALRPIAAAVGSVLGTMTGWLISIAKALAPVLIAFKVFAVVVGVALKVTHALIAIGIVKWVAGFLGLRLGALAFQGAMLLVRAAFVASTYAVAIFHAVSGPSGWAILAAAAAVAAGAIYGITKAYESAADAARDANDVRMNANGIGSELEDIKALAKEEEQLAKQKREWAEQQAKLEMEWNAKVQAQQQAIRDKITDARDRVRLELNTLGETDGFKAIAALRQEVERMNAEVGKRGIDAAQQADLDFLQAKYDELDVMKQIHKIEEQIADIEKESAQAAMTKGQRMLDDLRRLGATEEDLAAGQEAANKLDATEAARKNAEDAKKLAEEAKRTVDNISPFDKYKKQVEDITRLSNVGALKPRDAERALNAAGAGLLKSLSGKEAFKIESPKALLKGTADAELAADRAKTPIERLTEVEKQQLKEARDLARTARDQLDWNKQNQTVVAQF